MKETRKFLEQLQWETSPEKTHEYYLCTPQHDAEFEELVNKIKKHGYVVTIQGISYVCVDIGKYLYWTMWDSIEKTNFINRMRI